MARGRRLALILAAGALAAGSLAAAGCGSDNSDSGSGDTSGGSTAASVSGEIAGAGASSQDAAQEAWIAGFQTLNPDATISYDPVGSGGGREQFVAGGTVYGGTDAALADDELTGAQERCGGVNNLVEIPVYVSPIAIAYNLSGVDSLQLAPTTLAQIFSHKITKWNDPAIAADNPGVDLPDMDITTVSRSDESGTSENFQQYLAAVAPKDWTFEVSGDWPVKGGEAAQGTSGVVDAIGAGDGTIGYADESQVGDLSVVSVKVGEEYVAPSAEGAAKVVETSPAAEGRADVDMAVDIDRTTTESGAYPVVLLSYLIACQTYEDQAEADLVKGYLSYIVSDEGQAAASEEAGSAPLSSSVAEQAQSIVDAISAG
jgi:phosphate transport system substrate-binding protein